jgi:hypothetical protein
MSSSLAPEVPPGASQTVAAAWCDHSRSHTAPANGPNTGTATQPLRHTYCYHPLRWLSTQHPAHVCPCRERSRPGD